MRFRSYLLPAAIIAVGLALRLYQLEQRADFGFDQEVAAWWVRNLLVDHKFSLIGQEISVGGVYIGPFFYYFLSLFYYLFRLDPVAGNIMVTATSLLTMILIYCLSRRLFDQKTAVVSLFLYAISYRLIIYDRIVAPSNWVMLSAIAVCLFLLERRYLLLGVVVGLTLSIHPTAVLLFPIVAIYLLWNKIKPTFSQLISFLSPVIILVLPLLFFDLRHNYLNVSGALSAISSAEFLPSAYPFLFKFFVNLRIIATSFGQILLPSDLVWIKYPLIALLIFAFAKAKIHRQILFFWVIIPAIFLSFYRQHVPEYYFLISFPILLIFFSHFVARYKILFLFLILFTVISLQRFSLDKNLLSLSYKKAAVKSIADRSQGMPVQIKIEANLGQNTGFNYLIYFYHVKIDPNAKNKFTIFVDDRVKVI